MDSTPIGTNTNNRTMSQLDSIPIGTKHLEPTPRTKPTDSSTRTTETSGEKGKSTYEQTRSQTHHSQTRHQANLICKMIEIIENKKSRNTIQRKSVGNTRNRTCHTHCRTIMLCSTTVNIDARYAKIRRSIVKRILSNYAQG